MKRKIEDKQSEIGRLDSKYYRKLSEKGALESEKKVGVPLREGVR
jgi:hypothetical protein